jgi:hypothetical protein
MTEARRTGGRARRGAARALAIAALVPVFAFGLGGAAYADVTAVTGSAYGVSATVTVLGAPVTLAQTPAVALPPGGSATPITASLATVTLPGVLSTGVVTVNTVGTTGPAGSVQSSAQVAALVVGNGLITALAVDAVGSTCTSNEAGSTGATTIANLRVLGQPLVVATAPNTTVSLAGVGTLHVNEQIVTGTAPSSSITVNALRLELNVLGLAAGEIVVGQSVCGVTGTGVVVPTGAVGGVLLTGLVAVVFGANQIRRYRRGGPTPA